MNRLNEHRLLPAGSVVLLKESTKRVMIIGFCQAKPEETSVIYDYCGCLFPEGYMDADHLYLFDHEMIDTVYSTGYIDEEQLAFQERMDKVHAELKKES